MASLGLVPGAAVRGTTKQRGWLTVRLPNHQTASNLVRVDFANLKHTTDVRVASRIWIGIEPLLLASRFFQLSSGHAMIAPLLVEKFGWVDSDLCWWCGSARRAGGRLFGGALRGSRRLESCGREWVRCRLRRGVRETVREEFVLREERVLVMVSEQEELASVREYGVRTGRAGSS